MVKCFLGENSEREETSEHKEKFIVKYPPNLFLVIFEWADLKSRRHLTEPLFFIRVNSRKSQSSQSEILAIDAF